MLSFYSFGITLKKRTEASACTEYVVDPEQVALALSTSMSFSTGLLHDDVLYVGAEGLQKTVVGYRRGQLTGLYLEGSDEPIRIPLPPLVMIRTISAERTPQYQVYAVKARPKTLDTALFIAPLPNVYNSGGICWGSVQLRSGRDARDTDLNEDWRILLGSPFGSHAVSGKSLSHSRDIRQLYFALAEQKARVYPRKDLVPAKRMLRQVLGEKEVAHDEQDL